METSDIIRSLCKEKHISVTELESVLGFGNGSLTKKGSFLRSDRLLAVADYFHVSMEFLMDRPDPSNTFPMSQFEMELVKAFRQTRHQAAICDLLCISSEKRELRNA